MSPAGRAAVAVVLILVAVWVARLLASLDIAPWIAALVAPLAGGARRPGRGLAPAVPGVRRHAVGRARCHPQGETLPVAGRYGEDVCCG